jgi:hypothetical protein
LAFAAEHDEGAIMGIVSFAARIRLSMRIVVLVLLELLGVTASATTAPITWDGGGDPDFSWMNATNWLGNLAPTPRAGWRNLSHRRIQRNAEYVVARH